MALKGLKSMDHSTVFAPFVPQARMSPLSARSTRAPHPFDGFDVAGAVLGNAVDSVLTTGALPSNVLGSVKKIRIDDVPPSPTATQLLTSRIGIVANPALPP